MLVEFKRHATEPSRRGRTTDGPGTVYLAAIREYGVCKIGFTQGPPEERVKYIAGKLWTDAELVGSIPSHEPYDLERDLHRRFVEHRIRGEWFYLTPEIEAAFPQ